MIQVNPEKVIEIVDQVVRCANPDAGQSLEDVALALGMSTRSLQRQLAKQETSFSKVIIRAQRQYALELLVQNNLSISEIATALGYADPSNFCRAFHKWTGQSPKRCRSKMLAQASPKCSKG